MEASKTPKKFESGLRRQNQARKLLLRKNVFWPQGEKGFIWPVYSRSLLPPNYLNICCQVIHPNSMRYWLGYLIMGCVNEV